jgi:hypothetical protein
MDTEKPNNAASLSSLDKASEADKSKATAWKDLPTVLSGIAVLTYGWK